VIDGPFTEAKELVCRLLALQVKSKEEAIEWLKRAPFDGGTERSRFARFSRRADFAPSDPTGEIRKKEQKLARPLGAAPKVAACTA